MTQREVPPDADAMPWPLFFIIVRLAFFGTLSVVGAILALNHSRIHLDIITGVYSLLVARKLYLRAPRIANDAVNCFYVLFWCDVTIIGLAPLFAIASDGPFRMVPNWLVAAADAAFCWWATGALQQHRLRVYLANTHSPRPRISVAGMLATTLIMAAVLNTYRQDIAMHPFESGSSVSEYQNGPIISRVVTLRRRLPWGMLRQHLLIIETSADADLEEAEQWLLERTSPLLVVVNGKREWLDIEVEHSELYDYLVKMPASKLPTTADLLDFLRAKGQNPPSGGF